MDVNIISILLSQQGGPPVSAKSKPLQRVFELVWPAEVELYSSFRTGRVPTGGFHVPSMFADDVFWHAMSCRKLLRRHYAFFTWGFFCQASINQLWSDEQRTLLLPHSFSLSSLTKEPWTSYQIETQAHSQMIQAKREGVDIRYEDRLRKKWSMGELRGGRWKDAERGVKREKWEKGKKGGRREMKSNPRVQWKDNE